MTDCLLIGFNDSNFENYVNMVRTMGEDSGAYRDLALAFVDFDGRPQRSMDLLNHFYWQGRAEQRRTFHNADFLWPVITYLGSYLTKANLTFDYVSFPHLEADKLKEKLLRDDILTVAITTTLYVSPHPILEIISFVRRYNTSAKIIVGGPFISNQPRMLDGENMKGLFRSLGADFYVTCQEGEFALVNIIRALKTGSSLDAIDNIAYRQGDDYVITGSSIESNPLEENMVRYELFPRSEIGEFVSLRTAKSCPFSCAFCGFPQRAGKYKYLSVELVEQELNHIRDIGGVTTLTFIDDTFNVPKERFKELLRMMIRNQYGFKWNSFYRCDHGDEETIELMGRAGCEGIFLGIESGSDAMLKRMNKTAKRKDYLRAIPLLKQQGIATYASLIIGYPGETEETIAETLGLVEEARPDFFRAQLWYCDPITPIWNQKEKYGIRGSAFNWSHHTMDARTACDVIDRIFLSVPEEQSVWLPQFGFDWWSVFYLQRQGMTLDQVKLFVRCFNNLIKERLLNPKLEQHDPTLLRNLEVSCRFEEPQEFDPHAFEIFSGRSFQEAERYWLAEFKDETQTLNLKAVCADGSEFENSSWDASPCEVDQSLLRQWRATSSCGLSELLLYAYSILLSRLSGQPHVALLASLDTIDAAAVLPLKLSLDGDISLDEFAIETGRKIEWAAEHQRYVPYLLTHAAKLDQHQAALFDCGYVYCAADAVTPDAHGAKDNPNLKKALRGYPALNEALSLILEATETEGGVKLQLSYRAGRLKPEVMRQLSSYLKSLLEEVASGKEPLAEALGHPSAEQEESLALKSYAAEEFDF